MRTSVLPFFILTCMLMSIPLSTMKAQEITFSFSPETEQFAPDQFRTDLLYDDHEKSIRIRSGELHFDNGSTMLSGYDQLAFSADRAYVGALFFRGDQVAAEIYRTDGTPVHRIGELAEYDPDDPSITLFMLNHGSFIYRDNIAGFTYFDERGEEVFQIFNSSGSPEGESVSGLSATPFGREVMVYNPKIFFGDRTGSRIQRTYSKGETEPLANFSSLTIQSVSLHPSGRLMLVHAFDESSGNHMGKVLSYRGDVLVEVDYEDNEILELSLSPDGRYITARTSGRVLVHRVATGERLGSASFSERVQVASYMPDGFLAVMTGQLSDDNELEDLRAHIINIEARTVVRETTPLTAYVTDHFALQLQYIDRSTYMLTGTNREIILRHTL